MYLGYVIYAVVKKSGKLRKTCKIVFANQYLAIDVKFFICLVLVKQILVHL